MTKIQTQSILYSTYAFARRNKFGFNLTYIEGDRPPSPMSGFDTAYMRALFQYGYEGRGAAVSGRNPRPPTIRMPWRRHTQQSRGKSQAATDARCDFQTRHMRAETG